MSAPQQPGQHDESGGGQQYQAAGPDAGRRAETPAGGVPTQVSPPTSDATQVISSALDPRPADSGPSSPATGTPAQAPSSPSSQGGSGPFSDGGSDATQVVPGGGLPGGPGGFPPPPGSYPPPGGQPGHAGQPVQPYGGPGGPGA
ncbi:MAG TPA: hypothetical protein VGD67_24205, partial [Pseudonocardiaceae bacterium]